MLVYQTIAIQQHILTATRETTPLFNIYELHSYTDDICTYDQDLSMVCLKTCVTVKAIHTHRHTTHTHTLRTSIPDSVYHKHPIPSHNTRLCMLCCVHRDPPLSPLIVATYMPYATTINSRNSKYSQCSATFG